MSSRASTSLKLLITFGLVLFLITRVDLAKMAVLIAQAQWPLLVAALGLYFLSIGLAVLKWMLLVRAQGIGASYLDLASQTFIALFLGNVIPSNVGGDVVRAYGLARAAEGKSEAAAISVLVDRLVGLVAFLCAAIVTGFLSMIMLARSAELRDIEIASIALAIALVAASALLFSRRTARRGAFVFERKPLARFRPLASKVYQALQAYRSRTDVLFQNGFISLANVILTTFVWYLVGTSLGIKADLFYYFLFNPLIAFVLLVPISFNGLGAKEAAVVFFFGLVGVPQEAAFSMSLLFHLVIIATSLPGGWLWWRRQGRIPSEAYAGGLVAAGIDQFPP